MRPWLLTAIACAALAGCGEESPPPAPSPVKPADPPEIPGAAYGEYEAHDAGIRLVLRRADDPACERVLGRATACYTNAPLDAPASRAAEQPSDAGPVRAEGEEIAVDVEYVEGIEGDPCEELEGRYRFVEIGGGRELRLSRVFFEGREATAGEQLPCVPPERFRQVRPAG